MRFTKTSPGMKLRHRKGHFLSEVPPVLMVIFFLFVLPLLDLGTLAIRWAIALTAAREGAHAAAVALTYQTPAGSNPSALTSAPAAVNAVISKFNGYNTIRVNSVQVAIIETNIATQNLNRYTSKLTSEADTSANVYQLECVVNCDIDPLFAWKPPFLPSIAGLNAPLTNVVLHGKEFSEAPQGLND